MVSGLLRYWELQIQVFIAWPCIWGVKMGVPAPLKSTDGGFGAPQSVEGDNGSAFLGGVLGGLLAVAKRNMDGEPQNDLEDI